MDNSLPTGNEPPKTLTEPPRRWKLVVRDWLNALIIAAVLVVLLQTYVFNLSKVKGESMQPTLHDQDRLFVDKIVYAFAEPKRGEVVILQDPSPDVGRQFLVKRVVAIPGDEVEIRDRKLLVNGVVQSEGYTDIWIEDDKPLHTFLEKDEYFVLGDNRHHEKSKDSRRFGPVKRDLIIGRADLIIWPFNKFTWL
ncbi:signal peptidase I [Paenibacillus sp. GCM10027629]|uniref:signal peptidase I n=1 Tax=Paenibacillus sp. GCM10027629 TaxID=3273414 RepID=UPI0036257A02